MNFLYIANTKLEFERIKPFLNITAMIDIEKIGKKERQQAASNFISTHSINDVRTAATILPRDRILLRINPLYSGSADEIETAIESGAGKIMLPMFHSKQEVLEILHMLAGRAQLFLLAETPRSVFLVENYLDVLPANTVVYLGLNDLHLALNFEHMFQLFPCGIVELFANKARANGKSFGIGGVGCNPQDIIPFALVMAAHKILGSSWVILSQSFRNFSLGRFEANLQVVQNAWAEASATTELSVINQMIRSRLEKQAPLMTGGIAN